MPDNPTMLVDIEGRNPFAGNWFPEKILAEDNPTKRDVMGLKYIPETVDHWKLPSETIRDGGGDCEDLSIAWLASLETAKPEELCLVVGSTSNGWHACGRWTPGNTLPRLWYDPRGRIHQYRVRTDRPYDFQPFLFLWLDGRVQALYTATERT